MIMAPAPSPIFLTLEYDPGECEFEHRGRNGYFKAGGAEACDLSTEIHLLARSSRGPSDALRLVIPKSKARELGEWLIAHSRPGTRFPAKD